jgi:hypothetical protein
MSELRRSQRASLARKRSLADEAEQQKAAKRPKYLIPCESDGCNNAALHDAAKLCIIHISKTAKLKCAAHRCRNRIDQVATRFCKKHLDSKKLQTNVHLEQNEAGLAAEEKAIESQNEKGKALLAHKARLEEKKKAKKHPDADPDPVSLSDEAKAEDTMFARQMVARLRPPPVPTAILPQISEALMKRQLDFAAKRKLPAFRPEFGFKCFSLPEFITPYLWAMDLCKLAQMNKALKKYIDGVVRVSSAPRSSFFFVFGLSDISSGTLGHRENFAKGPNYVSIFYSRAVSTAWHGRGNMRHVDGWGQTGNRPPHGYALSLALPL